MIGLALALQVVVAPAGQIDTSSLATKAEVQAAQQAAADADTKATNAVSAASTAVKTVNGTTPNASGAVTLPIPTASNTTPPGVSDSGSIGTMTTMYALANHTHASKARRIIATSAADGSYTFNYSANPFSGPPVCTAVAEVAAGVTDVVNVQIIGTPTTTSASFLVNRANRSVASLLGLTVLSIPAQPGATKIHAICLEP
jgi:hypothetical protein